MKFICKLIACLFTQSIRTVLEDELQAGDVIVVPAFGCINGEEPGLSNIALAAVAFNLSIRLRKLIVAQVQVANALPFTTNLIHTVRRHHLDTETGRVKPLTYRDKLRRNYYVDTHEVLWQAKQVCGGYGNKIILVAHPLHVVRCAMVARKLGLEVFVASTGPIPCDPKSDQWETRTPIRWFIHDRIGRIVHLLKGDI